MHKQNNRIYIISPPQIGCLTTFAATLKDVFLQFSEYIFAFQLRLKGCNPSSVAKAAIEIQKICSEHNITFIVNDDVDLALKTKDAGVHLGQQDLSNTKRIPKDINLGITCHDNIQLAIQAFQLGASYVAFGSFFPSTTKPKALRKASIQTIEAWLKLKYDITTVAIGGINDTNYQELMIFPNLVLAMSHYIWYHTQGACYALNKITSSM